MVPAAGVPALPLRAQGCGKAVLATEGFPGDRRGRPTPSCGLVWPGPCPKCSRSSLGWEPWRGEASPIKRLFPSMPAFNPGRAAVPGVWPGKGPAESCVQAWLEAKKDNGLQSIHVAEGPQRLHPGGPSPRGDSTSHQNHLKETWRRAQIQTAFIHLFIYVRVLQKERTVQGTGARPRAASLCPLESAGPR